MTEATAGTLPRPAPARWPFYYGWVTLGVAAMSMVATLPGRTQGLGLVTEPLLRDLRLDRVLFAQINLVATLVGALFCLGVGRLVDRAGSRRVVTVVTAALGAVVLAMSGVQGAAALLVLVTLTRGLGQSALSVVSLAMVGKWFSRRLSAAMGVYAVVMSVGFMLAFPLVGAAVQAGGWRAAWRGVGLVLVAVVAPLCWLLARSSPEECGLEVDGGRRASAETGALEGATLGEALRTPAFWVFALSASVYGLAASGIALFNEAILAERGFSPATYYRSLVVTALVALLGNFGGGALAARGAMRRLLAAALLLLTASLATLPLVTREAHVVGYAMVMGLAGGFVMVVFFTFWGRAYGRAHLGRIQGAAQMLTVLASAVGPLIFARSASWTGSYFPALWLLAPCVLVLGISAFRVRLPGTMATQA
jgi:MFS family permease